MGTTVNVKAPPGGKIKGAIQGVKAPAPLKQDVTRGVTVPAATIPSYSSQELINRAKAVSRGPGVLADPRQERIARTVAFSESVPGLRQPEMASQLQKAALSGNDLFEYKNATPEQKALMDRISSTGLHVSMKTGLDPRLVLGQAMHESTTSKNKTRVSQLARDYNNLFGVKATGKPKEWDGVTTWSGASSTMPTGEYYGPSRKMYNEGFRVYDTPEQSLMDYGRLIESKYGTAGKFESIPEQARAIKAGGYATDPKYANALTKSANRIGVISDGVVTPAASRNVKPDGLMSLVPDAVKIGVAKNYAKEIGKDLAGYYKQGIEGLRGYFGTDAEPPSGAVKTGSKMVNLEPGDIYGPKYVAPEVQEVMGDQEKLNKMGIGVMKRVPVVGPVVTATDALTKLFTGETIAGGSAELKRAYMQATDEQKAVLEDKYPNLTKFASDAGLTPKRDMSNYTNWAEKSGLRAPPSREGGGENSGIASLGGRPKGDETTTPTPDTPSTTPGRRPDIYYMWDLGVNVPSPGDPNYTQYQTYLAERLSARQAVG
jgi:flagellum-specific peptidoglycan hydrolase FlgJ